MPDGAVTRQLIEQVSKAPPETRAMMVLALGYRGGEGVLPVLRKATKDQAAGVRAAAFKAIGVLGDEAAFDTLLKAFESDSDADRDAIPIRPGFASTVDITPS